MGSDPYIGEISIFAGNFAPTGWAMCDGRVLPIVQYQALYSLIGTSYGGDGVNNFALPDLRGRSALGMGAGQSLSPRSLAQKGGQEKVGLGQNELPSHSHSAQSAVSGTVTGKLSGVSEAGSASVTKGAFIASHANAFVRSGTAVEMNGGSIAIDSSSLQVATTVAAAGNGASHENMHPYIVLNYIIALEGIYPPRD